jgi:hypothetical protein
MSTDGRITFFHKFSFFGGNIQSKQMPTVLLSDFCHNDLSGLGQNQAGANSVSGQV